MIPNATCAFCQRPFRLRPHLKARHRREGKLDFCSTACAKRYYAGWKVYQETDKPTARTPHEPS